VVPNVRGAQIFVLRTNRRGEDRQSDIGVTTSGWAERKPHQQKKDKGDKREGLQYPWWGDQSCRRFLKPWLVCLWARGGGRKEKAKTPRPNGGALHTFLGWVKGLGRGGGGQKTKERELFSNQSRGARGGVGGTASLGGDKLVRRLVLNQRRERV